MLSAICTSLCAIKKICTFPIQFSIVHGKETFITSLLIDSLGNGDEGKQLGPNYTSEKINISLAEKPTYPGTKRVPNVIVKPLYFWRETYLFLTLK